MFKILISIAVCILITSILLYRKNKSRVELLSILMISTCMLFVLAFFFSFRHAELFALAVFFGIVILVLLFVFGKAKPIHTWNGILRQYREALYGDQYRVKDFASFIEVNKKKYVYLKKNYYLLLISIGITTLVVMIWVLMEKLIGD